jgi:hypothetical protein
VVGEHIHVFLDAEIGPFFLETVMDRFGEMERCSMEKRTAGDRALEV